MNSLLLLLPQRYIFSSKSQHISALRTASMRCCCYHKGTYFQANHNEYHEFELDSLVVVATTKVHIFKQITTARVYIMRVRLLLLLPQRYIFSSKSQRGHASWRDVISCCCYHKGTYFQANHNGGHASWRDVIVVVATTKVHIFKQITTQRCIRLL